MTLARPRWLLLIPTALAAVSCGAGAVETSATAPGASPCGKAVHPPAHYAHVVWVVMENTAYSSIIGASKAPYINRLARQCGSATNFKAEAHPSLPNYIAMTSGSTQGITDDDGPPSHRLNVASIFSEVGRGHWRALEESVPSRCDRNDSGEYAVRHNPAAYYTNIRTACAAQDAALRPSTPDISARFTFVTPNLCHDMHDCNIQTGDRWLRTFLPKVFATVQYKHGGTAVFLTWDEDDRGHSNHIATIVAARSVPPGTTSSIAFDHYSLLRTTEELLGLRAFLGRAATATSMRRAFNL